MVESDLGFLDLAMRRSAVLRAVKVSLFVGSILAVVNHADIVFAGNANASTFLKIALTYLVPYGVSTYSSVGAIREHFVNAPEEQ